MYVAGVRRRSRGAVYGPSAVLQQFSSGRASIPHHEGSRQVLPDFDPRRSAVDPDDRTAPEQVQRNVTTGR